MGFGSLIVDGRVDWLGLMVGGVEVWVVGSEMALRRAVWRAYGREVVGWYWIELL